MPESTTGSTKEPEHASALDRGRVWPVHAHGSSYGPTPGRQRLVTRRTGHDRTLFESPRLSRIHRRVSAGDAPARPIAAGLWPSRLVASRARVLTHRHSAPRHVEILCFRALTH